LVRQLQTDIVRVRTTGTVHGKFVMNGVHYDALLDTSLVPVRDREDAVQAALNSAVLPTRVQLDGPNAEVGVRMEGWQLGAGTRLLHVRSNGFRLTRTSKHLRMAAPERISLAIQLRGCCTLTQRDLTVVDRVGELELTDLTSPFDYVHRGEGAAEALYIDNDHPVRLRLGPPRSVVALVADDRLDFGQAPAGTCGHDRQTAATRCAEVRSPKRPAVPL
jgi:AraC-like protein